MKHFLTLLPALLSVLCGSAQNPSKSALEILDGRNYRILIDREVVNRWEPSSESFAIGLGDKGNKSGLLYDIPKADINSQEVVISDNWIIVNDDKIISRIGDILDYQLAGDGDVNKKNRMSANDNIGIREFEITEYKEAARKNKRNIDLTVLHDYGVRFSFKLSVTSKGLVNVRVYDKDGNQVREYKGVLDMDYGQ